MHFKVVHEYNAVLFQVKIWFQNRRMKWRNSKERELLSSGGSRDSTLPTRHNPNPDLSDVGQTEQKYSANDTNNKCTENSYTNGTFQEFHGESEEQRMTSDSEDDDDDEIIDVAT